MSIEGAGPCRFWGFSPALDLAAEVPPESADGESADGPLRFLMVCPSDARHMLKTAGAAACKAHESKTPARAMEFCVYEREPENLARHLLFLAIALDFELPRRERAEKLTQEEKDILERAGATWTSLESLRRQPRKETGPGAAVE